MTELELRVEGAANGGSCVARSDGRVVFVRHALPGELVRAVITEDTGGSFCRADAVEVLEASPDRVDPPCPHAGPGRCGGCDWQHASGPAQPAIKAAVVREQFARIAGIDLDLPEAEPLPGGLLGWRTRVSFAVGADGMPGLHRHRSNELEPVTHCPLGVEQVSRPRPAPAGCTAIEAAVGDDPAQVAVLARRPGPGRQARGRRPPDRIELVDGPPVLRHRIGKRSFAVAAEGFWQVHPQALPTFAAAVLEAAQLRAGETVVDLYAGAGPLTAVCAEAVGPSGRVIGVESSAQAVADATGNLAELPWAHVRRGRVDAALVTGLGAELADDLGTGPDVVVLDPPRAGAGAQTVQAILALGPRRVVYLSCDPATLARDVRAARESGWQLAGLRAFDAFPMTHHVECLATLVPPG